ncbi:hypothetical protein SAMN05421734_102195 [Pelagirhabdus alkalitolerans]|uniref:Swarming motility protein SwrB n=1 Tax=Pelagirhabdus alkalitolerans TaxID=1612202 RepID=A0A1G6H673_9BACI|nr:hypothetical protein [Pelagirhabdus alkalitolerans]SDB88936.1 hypothetical protein SAMN05421734_102195 [Pelagirhabdus alkalitolerans]
MIYILLFISFIIHAVTFIIIKQLIVKLDKPDQVRDQLSEQKKEIEELLAVYLVEMREENDRFIELVNDKVPDQQTYENDTVRQTKHESNENKTAETKINPAPYVDNNKQKASDENLKNDYKPPEINEQDTYEQSFAGEVLSLYSQGYTTDEIAQQLNRGKTEVELLVKFQQNK